MGSETNLELSRRRINGIIGAIACGERVLLPEVRKAGKETLIIADGFSCREQIGQTTDRRALHIAQVLKMAIDEGRQGPAGNYPGKRYVALEPSVPSARTVLSLLAICALGLGILTGLVGRRSDGRRSLS